MANCPNCGSEHIQLTKDANVDWGRAAAGYVLFGVAGGVVGAVTGGDEKNSVVCLNCGTSWKPAQLHQILTTIKQLSNLEIDLTKSSHRVFVNDFVDQATKYFEVITETEKNAKQLIETAETGNALGFGGCGCLVAFIIFMIFSSLGSENAFAIGIVIYFSIQIIGVVYDSFNKDKINRNIENAKFESERMKTNAREELNKFMQDFINSHPLD